MCNCGGSNKAQQKTGTLKAVDRQGWYWTGPSGPTAPAAPAAPAPNATPSA